MSARFFSRHETHDAEEPFVGRGGQLLGHIAEPVGVVPRVADGQRLFRQTLPASLQVGIAGRIAGPFEESAAG